ncbi:single-stranded DNA-binding protein [Propionimicrobium sp. PCR01-08-3]|uniref:single-stranded DNA-binding protein n=1 Tax=Propionimicrobium sp. PCR01-08-3 TaxID=3052086 RepID=UPI00255CC375|nr:single-stranded DNA-binding protein [Propionimicrobium sp. PCR01-08-3]WIY84317.1 single-stranded DNA-binding protein [Propionimicrobium sp. PCR01-08-3]
MSIQTIIVGNLTGDVSLRFTPAGQAVANFTIAQTDRKFDRQTNEWTDGDTSYLDCTIWQRPAENAAETLRKGMRVVATGRLLQRNYEDRQGNKRSKFELQIDEVGPSLKTQVGEIRKAGSARPQTQQAPAQYPGNDPWADTKPVDAPPF